MGRSSGGRRRKEGICYSCCLTEEFSPQTRKEPDLDKEGRKERVPQLLPIRILSHIITHSHATRCTHTQYSLPSDACHINLTYMAFSNYDYGNKSFQCVPCHRDELLKGELGEVLNPPHYVTIIPPLSKEIFTPKGNLFFCKTICETWSQWPTC